MFQSWFSSKEGAAVGLFQAPSTKHPVVWVTRRCRLPKCGSEITEQVVAEVEAAWRRRQDMGLPNRAMNLLFEPKNIFDPKRRRTRKKDVVVGATLVLFAMVALVYFNILALTQ